ncbi:MAG: hypothetical protein JZU47_01090 [Prolixibacteraceae bacterium]|nr:hypothetical protein [Prolixibacteraceae bacterium]
MKSLIVAFDFAIGLMIALPDPSLGSSSPPDQSSFVVGQFEIAPAIAPVQEIVFVSNHQLAPEYILVQEKGGGVEVQGLKLATQPTYLINWKVNASVDLTQYCKQNFRTCYLMQERNYLQRNISYSHRFARDGLTWV